MVPESSPSMVPGSVVSVSPGNSLQMQISKPGPRLSNLATLGRERSGSLWFKEFFKWFWFSLKLEITTLKWQFYRLVVFLWRLTLFWIISPPFMISSITQAYSARISNSSPGPQTLSPIKLVRHSCKLQAIFLHESSSQFWRQIKRENLNEQWLLAASAVVTFRGKIT